MFNLILSEKAVELFKEQIVSTAEQSLSANLAERLKQYFDESEMKSIATMVGLGMTFTQLVDNPSAPTAVAGRVLVRGSMHAIMEKVKDFFNLPEIRNMMKEGGELYEVTDPLVILTALNNHYALKNAERSRFNSYRFNKQGGQAVKAVQINLEEVLPTATDIEINLDGAKKKIMVKGTDGLMYPVDIKRSSIKFIQHTPSLWVKDDIHLPWPAYLPNELNTAYLPAKNIVLSEEPIPVLNKGRYYNPNVKRSHVTTTRRDIHIRLTDILNEEISPELLMEQTNGVYPDAFDESLLRVSAYSKGKWQADYHFNTQLAVGATGTLPEGVEVKGSEDTIATSATTEPKPEAKPAPKAETKPQENKEDIPFEPNSESKEPATKPEVKEDGTTVKTYTFPITHDQCATGSNKYTCPRCGATNLRKKNLSEYTHVTLPNDLNIESVEGFGDVIKYTGSVCCSRCREELKRLVDSTIRDYDLANTLSEEYIVADDEAKAATKELEEAEAFVKSASNKVPEAMQKSIEAQRNMAQGKVAKAAKIEARLKSVEHLIKPATSTTTNAVIISKPNTNAKTMK